jgi:hypothetical protein
MTTILTRIQGIFQQIDWGGGQGPQLHVAVIVDYFLNILTKKEEEFTSRGCISSYSRLSLAYLPV